MKGLIIVESPTKVKTVKKIVKRNYDVMASVGHVIDLPKSKLGIDPDTLEPQYVTIKGKAAVINEIKKKSEKADMVILATDPDREGEAIAYHIMRKLADSGVEIKRARFTEITEKGINEALNELSDIDMNMFYSQQTRRILDRLVGYRISPILWRIMYKGLSAALRLIAERQAEIDGFIPEKYWEITAAFGDVTAKLVKTDGKRSRITEEKDFLTVMEELSSGSFIVESIDSAKREKRAKPPFITSTLQQEAYNRLGYSAKKTMMLAQRLYEGIALPGGNTGLITYMRTDSFRVSQEALNDARAFIARDRGERYLPEKPNFYAKKKGTKIQDAHEAIRPTSVFITPDSLSDMMEKDLHRLYKLIWERFVASQMVPAIYQNTVLSILNGRHLFEAEGAVRVFDGFENIYRWAARDDSPMDISGFEIGKEKACDGIFPDEKETQPPACFTDASLVKKLEALGIGRPSTYAQIITVLINRQYVQREARKLICTDLGMIVNDTVRSLFPRIVDYEFTENMENDLDDIENGESGHKEILRKFYDDLTGWLEDAEKDIPSIKESVIQKTEIKCAKCGMPMIIRWGRNGRFLACSGYPECKNTMDFEMTDGKPVPVEGNLTVEGTCPECGSGLVKKRGRFGEFIACSRYPECRYTKKVDEKIGVTCPKCGTGHVVRKKSKKGRYFYGCDRYPQCDFVDWNKPTGAVCPECGEYLVEKGKKTVCSRKGCGYATE